MQFLKMSTESGHNGKKHLLPQSDCDMIQTEKHSDFRKTEGKDKSVKKIGHEVLFLGTSENNPRNGESTFVRLDDGRILFAYTEYYSTCGEDHGTARICACTSADEGETWSEPRIIIEKDDEAQNIMSPALLRVPDGTVGIFYLRKQFMPDGGLTCMPCFRKSADDAETWGEECRCTIPDGYYCGINDGALTTSGGRILWPVSYHGIRYDATGKCTLKIEPVSEIQVVYSDDSGATWGVLPGKIRSPFASTMGNLAEPGICEQDDGTLWLWMRTGLGHQYDTVSADGGNTWLSPEPNLRFTSPDCPMRVKRFRDASAAVFNPVPFHCLSTTVEAWNSPKRTPIVCAVTRGDTRPFSKRGVSFVNGGMQDFVKNVYLLEDDTSNSYCYPSLLETADGFLVSYYHSSGTPYCLKASKIVKVLWSEIG